MISLIRVCRRTASSILIFPPFVTPSGSCLSPFFRSDSRGISCRFCVAPTFLHIKSAAKLAGLLISLLKDEDPKLETAVRGMGKLVKWSFGKFVSCGLNGEKQKLMEMVTAKKRPQLKGEIMVYEALVDFSIVLRELYRLLGWELIL